MAVSCIDCAIFSRWKNKETLVLFSTRDKKVAITFYENQILILEKFEELPILIVFLDKLINI